MAAINSNIEHKKSNELTPYYIVEFINRGRKPNIKKIDIVVSSWLHINEKTDKMMTKFPSSPYNSLQLYLEHQLEASSSWLTYPVRIRGKADTLPEAEKKMNHLNEVESVLTLSSDENVSEAERRVNDTLKQKVFLQNARDFKEKISKEVKDHAPANDIFEENDSDSNELDNFEFSGDNQINDQNIYSKCNQTKDLSKINKNKFNISSSSSLNMENTPEDTINPSKFVSADEVILKDKVNIRSKSTFTFKKGAFNNNVVNNTELQTNKEKKRKHENENAFVNIQNKRNSDQQQKEKKIKSNSSQEIILDYLLSISNTLIDLKSEVKTNGIEINSLKVVLLQNCRMNSNKFITNSKELSSKYEYRIPFRVLMEFKRFDAELVNRKSDLIKDITSFQKPLLLSGLDGSLIISKSIVNIFKMFLTKHIALQFTASKKVHNKEVMKKTNFYSIVEGVIKDQRIKSNLSVSDKEFLAALSSVLTNVPGWKRTKFHVTEELDPLEVTLNGDESSNETYDQEAEDLNKLCGTYNLVPVNDQESVLNKVEQ